MGVVTSSLTHRQYSHFSRLGLHWSLLEWEARVLQNVQQWHCPCPVDSRNTGKVESCVEGRQLWAEQKDAQLESPGISDLG